MYSLLPYTSIGWFLLSLYHKHFSSPDISPDSVNLSFITDVILKRVHNDRLIQKHTMNCFPAFHGIQTILYPFLFYFSRREPPVTIYLHASMFFLFYTKPPFITAYIYKTTVPVTGHGWPHPVTQAAILNCLRQWAAWMPAFLCLFPANQHDSQPGCGIQPVPTYYIICWKDCTFILSCELKKHRTYFF